VFVVCYVIDSYKLLNGQIENHINTEYITAISNKDDLQMYKQIFELASINNLKPLEMINKFRHFDINQKMDQLRNKTPLCGQKMVPLTIGEAAEPEDINHSIWREIFIGTQCFNLVLNHISPSFPFVSQWFFIPNSTQDLYDNEAMLEKYRLSNIGKDINSKLIAADALTFEKQDIELDNLNADFGVLSDSIKESIHNASSNVELSDTSLCIMSENAGLTFVDAVTRATNKTEEASLVFMFEDKDVFAHQMFQYIYGALCMHSCLGVIHSDLHLNNVSIFPFYSFRNDISEPNMNLKSIYSLLSTAYIFPYRGLYSTIFDFSRAVLVNEKLLKTHFGNTTAWMYIDRERPKLIKLIERVFPEFYTANKKDIQSLAYSRFELMFKVSSALDIYYLMSNILSHLQGNDEFMKSITFPKESKKLLETIIKQAKDIFFTKMRELFKNNIQAEDSIEWPALTIITSNFAEFEFTYEKLDALKLIENASIANVYKYSLTMDLDINNYDKWGDIMSLEPMIVYYKKHGYDDDAKDLEDIRDYNSEITNRKDIETIISKYSHYRKYWKI
jgi:hypothetical protein